MERSPTKQGERRATLLGIKLRALASDHIGEPVVGEPEPLPNGVVLRHGSSAWVLIDGDAAQSLGAVLVWATRRGAASIDVVADSGGGVLARRAMRFAVPISVWTARERTLLRVEPEPLRPPPELPDDHRAFAEMIAGAGASVNVEHGVLFGEVRGLEVCRVVDEPTVGFIAEPGYADPAAPTADGVLLEVGVGAADREAFHLMHGELPTAEALATVVRTVVAHRSATAGAHPLNRLGRERFLRWTVEQAPDTVGLVELAPAEPPVPRPNLKDPSPCVAVGRDAGGRRVTVVFSAGVDVELLPFVADVQATTDDDVVVALPARDLLPITHEVAQLLLTPIEFVLLD